MPEDEERQPAKEIEQKKKMPFAVVMVAVIAGSYVFMRFIIQPPFPATLTNFYMLFVIAGTLLHMTLSDKRINEVLDFFSFKTKEDLVWDIVRKAVVVIIPLIAASNVYSSQKVSYAPPAELFSPHVTPPQWVVSLKVPEWAEDTAKWAQKDLEEGKVLYDNNCMPCHGKDGDGKGPMATAIRYPASPTNFKEAGTIAQLPITYVYWRVKEGVITDKQFRSAMPAWQSELTDDEIWKVIMYTYANAGVKPRTWE
ncbi:Cytochrome c [Candidatus Magnetoovum chiemensis]|nr:Cytochrome c [Candidatus Magnetoovum chiemensis]